VRNIIGLNEQIGSVDLDDLIGSNEFDEWNPQTQAEKPVMWDLCEIKAEDSKPHTEIEGDIKEINTLLLQASQLLEKEGITYDSKYRLHCSVVGVEVGDDRLCASRNPDPLAQSLVGQESIFGMITSPEDTFLTPLMWNLCEHSDGVPYSPEQCWNRTRKSGDAKNLAYTDYPPLRVIVDAGGSNQQHLKSVSGKASLLANQSQLTRPECAFVMELAHFLQDGLITSYRGTEPKYLPKNLGGSGCPSLFGIWENLYLSVLSYRGGGYSRVYGSATNEAHRTLLSMENGAKSVSTPLLTRLRMRQEYLHGTYAEQILIPSRSEMERYRVRLPDPLYESKAVDSALYGTEERLIRARVLLRRPEAEIEVARTYRANAQLFGYRKVAETSLEEKYLSQKARKSFEGALCANSAFKNLLDRKANREDPRKLIESGFDLSVSGVQEFAPEQAQWIFLGSKTEVYHTEDIPQPHDIFVRDEVSTEESMKIGNIPLRPLQRGTQGRSQVTTTRVGLYEIGPGMLEWAKDKVDQLKKVRDTNLLVSRDDLIRVYSHNPEWVRDDSLLIGEALRRSIVTPIGRPIYLVSADLKLARRIANSVHRDVYVLDPSRLVAALDLKVLSAKVVIPPSSITKVVRRTQYFVEPGFTLVDSGSLLHATMNMERKAEGKVQYYKRYLTGYRRNGPSNLRSSDYRLEPVRPEIRIRIVSAISRNARASRRVRDITYLKSDRNWRRKSESSSSSSSAYS
jgi:hypothetical protein